MTALKCVAVGCSFCSVMKVQKVFSGRWTASAMLVQRRRHKKKLFIHDIDSSKAAKRISASVEFPEGMRDQADDVS